MELFTLDLPFPSPECVAALVSGPHASAWLDSADADHPRSRFSVVAPEALAVLSIQNQSHGTLSLIGEQRAIEHPWEFLEAWSQALKPTADSELPFVGGAIGFLAYESFRDHLPFKLRDAASKIPEACFLLVDTGMVLDHRQKRAWIFSLGLKPDLRTQEVSLAKARCEGLLRKISHVTPLKASSGIIQSLQKQDNLESYCKKVRAIQDAILRGDCYQVNLSQKFVVAGEWNPAALYLKLREASPAPQMAFFQWNDRQILSASPEILCETLGNKIFSYPIKGTRPRGASPEEDIVQRQALEKSEKDAAELLMIVDLVRNDLGKICETGSVEVSSLGEMESFAQVHHRVACIQGRLQKNVSPLQAVRSISPGGSITGAPKLKAMEIIQALESGPRGIYTGSIGYLSLSGRSCFNIAIRSAYLSEGKLEFSAGGGIVADSLPEAEYRESMVKAEAILRTLGLSSSF